MLLHRRRGALLGLVLSGAAAASAQAQANLPPVARASALPTQVAPGDPVQLMGSSSFDPDMGPSALTFEWDFGDGMTSTVPDPTHAWASAGIYPASLTVRDGQTQSLALVEIHVLDPPTPSPPTASSPIWLDEANGRIWAVNPDSGTVSVVDLASASVAVELDVGVRPVSVRGGGSRVLVAVQGEGLVVTFDRDAMTRTGELAVGPRPYGVTDVPGSGEWLVALEASDRVVRLASDAGSIVATYDVCDGPRALAVEHAGDRAFAACFLSRGDAGHVSAIDLANGTVSDVALAEDPGPDTATSGRGIPSLLGALAIDPAGGRLWVGGLKANTGRGVHVNGEPLVFTNRLRALFAPIDLTDLGDLVQRRIDANDADSVSAIAFDHSGRWAFLAHAGAGRVSSYDLSRARFFVPGVDGDTVPFAARFDVGDAPSGLALSSDGTRLYVWSELSRELRIVDVTDPAVPSELSAIRLTDEPLPADVAEGKRLFHRSRAPEHSGDNYIACASCHPDGGHDGRTWDFTQFGEGLRNTIDLRGHGGTAHGPLHWSANFDEVQDFENDIVDGFHGTGLAMDGMGPYPPLDPMHNAGRSAALDALAAYVTSLTDGTPSPHRGEDGYLTDAARRGRAIFEDPAVRCAECHAAPLYTDSTLTSDPADYVLHDVGTIDAAAGMRLGGPLPGFDTPTLIGVWESPPYLHDGRAATLREVLVEHNADDRHGVTSGLDDPQLDDLVAYMLELDGRPEDPPPPGSDGGVPDGGVATDAGPTMTMEGCTCRASGGHGGRAWWWLGGLLVSVARRRKGRST